MTATRFLGGMRLLSRRSIKLQCSVTPQRSVTPSVRMISICCKFLVRIVSLEVFSEGTRFFA